MHDFDRFRSDMANRSEPGNPNSDSSVSNLFRYDRQQLIPNCTVITLDGLDGFMRINLACPRARLQEALNRICSGLRRLLDSNLNNNK